MRHRTACPMNTPVRTVFFGILMFAGHGGSLARPYWRCLSRGQGAPPHMPLECGTGHFKGRGLQGVARGCQSSWGRLLSVTSAAEAGGGGQEESGWVESRPPPPPVWSTQGLPPASARPKTRALQDTTTTGGCIRRQGGTHPTPPHPKPRAVVLSRGGNSVLQIGAGFSPHLATPSLVLIVFLGAKTRLLPPPPPLHSGFPPRKVDARGSADARSSTDACLS